MLSAAALSIVLTVYQNEEQRKAALALWSGLGVIGAILGAVLGGLSVSAVSWRWAFLINIPVCELEPGASTTQATTTGVRARVPGPGDLRRPCRGNHTETVAVSSVSQGLFGAQLGGLSGWYS